MSGSVRVALPPCRATPATSSTPRGTALAALLSFGALVALVLAAGCTKTDSTVQTGETFATTTTTSPPSTKGNLGAELGRITPEASTAFMREAAERTQRVRTGRFGISVSVEDVPEMRAGENLLLDISLEYDRDANLSAGTLDISGLAELMSAGPGVDVDAIRTIFAEPFDIVTDGDYEYLRSEDYTRFLGATTPWVRSASTSESSFGQIVDQFDVGNVGEFLGSLESGGEVDEIGTETINAIDVTHFYVEVDLADLDDEGSRAVQNLFGDLTGAISVDVWIDDVGIIHRLEMVADATSLGKELGVTISEGTATVVIEFSDFGEPVDIEVPPADEVTDASELRGGRTTTSLARDGRKACMGNADPPGCATPPTTAPPGW